MSYCCYFSQFTTSKPRSIVFIAIVRTRAGEKNNLTLPFPSQSNIIEKKKTLAGRMLDPQGFFFFGAIYRSSAWCCRFLSLNFYQWAALGPFEKPAGVRTMKQGCLYIWATKVIAVFTRNRISKKTSCHRHLKSCSPLLFFFFFFFSHWAVYL